MFESRRGQSKYFYKQLYHRKFILVALITITNILSTHLLVNVWQPRRTNTLKNLSNLQILSVTFEVELSHVLSNLLYVVWA